MKRYLLLSLLILSISFANAGILPVGGYIGIRGGSSSGGFKDSANLTEGTTNISLEAESKPHFFGSINAGLRLSLPFLNTFRLEVEGLGRNNGVKVSSNNTQGTNTNTTPHEMNVSSFTTLANVYYDVIDLPFIRGYVGGGIGYTKFATDLIPGSNIDKVGGDKSLAYNIGAGATLSLMDVLSFDVGARYFHHGQVSVPVNVNKKEKLQVNSVDIYAGIRFGF